MRPWNPRGALIGCDARQPTIDLVESPFFLICFHRKGGLDARAGSKRGKDRQTAPEPISAMGDEGVKRLAFEIMRPQERTDHRRGGFPPDRETQIDRFVPIDILDCLRESRFDAVVTFYPRLLDGRVVIFRVRDCCPDLEN